MNKKNQPAKKILSNNVPSIEPCGTPKKILIKIYKHSLPWFFVSLVINSYELMLILVR